MIHNAGFQQAVNDLRAAQAKSSPSSNAVQLTNPPSKSKATNQQTVAFALKVLRFALLGAIGFVGWLNIKPYVNFVDFILYGDGQTAIVLFLSSLPVIGFVIGLARSIGSFFLGALLWAGIQTAETLPTLMNTSDGLQQMVSAFANHKPIKIEGTATALTRKIAKSYNDTPKRWIRQLYWITAVAYVLDFLIVFITYPPISGGIEGIRLWLAAPDFASVDMWNLTQMMVVLFAFEAIVFVWVFLWEARKMGIDPVKQRRAK